MRSLGLLICAALAAVVVSATPLEKRQNCPALYGQCGGSGYTGAACCSQGVCVCQNQYYCQCVPGTTTAGASSTRSSTTTTTTTTTTPASSSIRSSTTTTTPRSSTTTGGPATACTLATITVSTTVTVVSTTTLPCTSVPVSPTASPVASSTTRASTTTGGPTSTVSGSVPTATVTPFVPPNLGTNVDGNPYQGLPRFVNPNYVQSVQRSIDASTDATFRTKAEKVKQYPSFRWLDTISSISTLPAYLAAAEAQAAGSPLIVEIVVYNLPGRDCAADSSNGEIMAGGIATYKTQYIDPIVSILSRKAANIRTIILLEPDSLPNLATNMGILRCNATTQAEYPDGVGYAIAKLSALPNTFIYLDAAHGGWLGWPDNQQKIIPIFQNALSIARTYNPSATIRGFGSNTANYDPFNGNNTCPAKEKCPLTVNPSTGNLQYDWNEAIDENKFTAALSARFGPAGLPTRWIHDSSRGGVNGIRQYWGSWCNAKGAGIGLRPANNPSAVVDALVWVKPPGESDGISGPPGVPRLDQNCNPLNNVKGPTGAAGSDALDGAPQAGQWFDAQFKMLVANANPAL